MDSPIPTTAECVSGYVPARFTPLDPAQLTIGDTLEHFQDGTWAVMGVFQRVEGDQVVVRRFIGDRWSDTTASPLHLRVVPPAAPVASAPPPSAPMYGNMM